MALYQISKAHISCLFWDFFLLSLCFEGPSQSKMSNDLAFHYGHHKSFASALASSEPQWLVDTSPTSSYNGSIADVDVLIGGFEFLGMSLSLGLAALYVASLWFLYQNQKQASAGGQATVGQWLWSTVFCSAIDTLTFVERIVKFTLRKMMNREDRTLAAEVAVGFVDPSASISAYQQPHGLRHLAVIMDGNRRYGKRLVSRECHAEESSVAERPATSPPLITGTARSKELLRVMATSPLNGHRAGGEKLMEVIEHCIKHKIEMLTVYAFSTENWNRSQEEIDVLMFLFEHFFQRIRESASRSGIFIRFVSTEPQLLPQHILQLMETVEEETRKIVPRRIVVNCCVSYGGRSEIVHACRRLAQRSSDDDLALAITESSLQTEMLRSVTQGAHEDEDCRVLQEFGGVEPHVLLRTSGEARVSNFLMYETAYSELVFVNKSWPEVDEDDIRAVIGEYCRRQRRFGK